MGGGGGAQRPVWGGNELKKTDARSAWARTRGQNPLVHYKNNVYDRSVPDRTFFSVLRIRDILVRTPWIHTSD
jgi:hypothetical protein